MQNKVSNIYIRIYQLSCITKYRCNRSFILQLRSFHILFITVTPSTAKLNKDVIRFIKRFAKTEDTEDMAIVGMVLLDKLVEAFLVSIVILKLNAIELQ